MNPIYPLLLKFETVTFSIHLTTIQPSMQPTIHSGRALDTPRSHYAKQTLLTLASSAEHSFRPALARIGKLSPLLEHGHVCSNMYGGAANRTRPQLVLAGTQATSGSFNRSASGVNRRVRPVGRLNEATTNDIQFVFRSMTHSPHLAPTNPHPAARPDDQP